MDKLKKDNILRFVEGLNLDLRRRQFIGKLIEEIVDSFADGVPAATPNSIGGVKQGPKVANASSDADTVALGTKINELIASLRSAGVII